MNINNPNHRKYALYLDRDGTLNVNTHYPHLAEDVYLCPLVQEFFHKLFYRFNLVTIIVTNQSGVSRGFYTKQDCFDFNFALANKIYEETGYYINNFYHAWGLEGQDIRRKPSPILLFQAALEHNLIPGYMIGDKDCDIEAGNRAGCFLSIKVDHKNTTLLDAYDLIFEDLKHRA